MKKIIIIAMIAVSSSASAESVRGYTRSDGTYVQGYQRSSGDEYRSNNYGSQSNGGYQRDEYSSGGGATNRSNPSYGIYDNNNNGVSNSLESPYGR